MSISLSDIVNFLPLSFSQGDSMVIKRLLLKNDNEFLRFKGKNQFDKKVKNIYPNIIIDNMFEEYLFAYKKSQSVLRLCKLYKQHGNNLFIIYNYSESFDNDGNLIGSEHRVLDRMVRSVFDPIWNLYLPPIFPTDSSSFTSYYKNSKTEIPKNLPNSNFVCDLSKLLSKITPITNQENRNDSYEILASFGIDLESLILKSFTEEYPHLKKHQLKELIKKFK